MKHNLTCFFFGLALLCCSATCSAQPSKSSDYWALFNPPNKDEYGYKNRQGQVKIPLGKYPICYTDTFRLYAIVLKPGAGFVAINRQEKVLCNVFPFDNGPDYVVNGLFRIVEHGKIGYADAKTGKVVIRPQFACAWPFEKGVAKVSNACKTVQEGEHSTWQSNGWYYINKKGGRLVSPKPAKKPLPLRKAAKK